MRDFSIIYRTTGVRTLNQLLTTRIIDFTSFQFPKRALLHYYTFDTNVEGPDEHLFYLEALTQRILTENIITYQLPSGEQPLGTPRLHMSGVNNAIIKFFFKHKKFRLYKEPYINSKEENKLSMVNYSYIGSIYKYQPKMMVDYYVWHNLFSTIVTMLDKVGTQSTMNQFLFIKVPMSIPSISQFRRFTEPNQVMLSTFDTPELLTIRDIYLWISEDKEHSLLSRLSVESLKKLNFVFYSNSKYYLLNAYYLHSFNKDNESTLQLSYKAKAPSLVRIFLNSLILLNSAGIVEVNPEETTTIIPQKEEVIDEVETDNPEATPEVSTDTTDSGSRIDASATGNTQYLSDADLDKDTTEDDLAKAIQQMEDNLEALERNVHLREVKDISIPITHAEVVTIATHSKTPDQALTDKLNQYNEYEVLTGAEFKALQKKLNQSVELKSPYNPNETLASSIVVTKEETTLVSTKDQFVGTDTLLDKTMLRSTLADFDKKYIEKTMHKDIAAMIVNLQHAGIIIEDYKIDPVYAITGDYEVHTVKVHPIDGRPSTLYFKLPIVGENGEFVINQIKYRSRKQRGDLPIKKIGKDTVALTSYYNKLFVSRSQRKANTLSEYIFKYIFDRGVQNTDKGISDVKINDVFDNLFKCPKMYSTIATSFESFKIGDVTYQWDHKKIVQEFTVDFLKTIESDGSVCCGSTKNNLPVIITKDNEFFIINGNEQIALGNFYQIANIPESNAPVEFTNLRIFSKEIPLAAILGHYLGLENLLTLTKAKHRIVDAKIRNKDIKDNEYSIVFKDKVLILDKSDIEATLILGGLLDFKGNTSKYNMDEFNKSNVYFVLLADKGISAIYVKEIDLLRELFIDPITKELLEELKEPTTFIGILLKANELLTVDEHPDDLDMRNMRIKGYERMAGNLYSVLTKAVRSYKLRNNRGQSKIDLPPSEVFKVVTSDPANILVTDINPIQSLKQVEAVTYLGEGGRARDVMNKASRRYHPTDMGIISEATVDSSDVAINTYLSANPLFTSTRGLAGAYNFEEDKATSLLSTSALTAPGSMHDDPKRVF